MTFNLNGFNFNQSVVDSQGRVLDRLFGQYVLDSFFHAKKKPIFFSSKKFLK